METTTKKYVQLENSTFNRMGAVEVQGDIDAVQQALSNRGYRFKTYEQTFAEVGGEILKGEPKNHSDYSYVGVDKIWTLQEVIDAFQVDLDTVSKSVTDEFSKQVSSNSLSQVIAHYKDMDVETCFLSEPGRAGDFIRLNTGEKVYDSQGQMLWPAPDTLAASPQADPAP